MSIVEINSRMFHLQNVTQEMFFNVFCIYKALNFVDFGIHKKNS